MLDIHSHIIFGVDDGPKTAEESLELLKLSYQQGVRGIVATSHRRKGMFETPEAVVRENFKQVQALAKTISEDFFIFYGAEIYFTDDVIGKLERKELPTYGNSSSVLIEFSGSTSYKKIQEAVRDILRLGLTPILAHIERYDALAGEGGKVADLIAMGAYMQINSSSVLKPKLFGDRHKNYKQRAQYFLDNEMVHFVASDMHNTSSRPPYMDQAFQLIEKEYGRDRAKALLIENPIALMQNKL